MTRADTSEEHAAHERVAEPAVALPEAMRAALADFAVHLEVAQGTSAHTVRAYTGDVESLLRHAVRHGAAAPRDVDLAALRAGASTEAMARAAGLAVADVVGALGRLEARGLAERAPVGWRRVREP